MTANTPRRPSSESTQRRETRTFGRLFKDEAEYMLLTNVPPLCRLVYDRLVLRARPNRVVVDGVDSLAKWTGLGGSTVRACLADLTRRGIIKRQRSPIREGRGSFATRTELVPYEDWPTEPLMRYVAATVAYVNVFYPSTNGHVAPDGPTTNRYDIADGPTTNRYVGDDQPLPQPRPTAMATRSNPDTYPESYPEGTSRARAREAAAAAAPPGKVRNEERAAVREAVQLWTQERERHRERSGEAYSRFTDPRALQNLRTAVQRALVASEWRDIAQGIRIHAASPNGNPYYVDEWAREQTGLRLETEAITRKMAERDDERRAGIATITSLRRAAP